MRIKKSRLWLIVFITILSTFIILEIVSQMLSLKGVLFSNNLKDFKESINVGKYYPLVLDNIILFLIALLLPVLLASKYTRAIPELKYTFDKKGFPVISKNVSALQYRAEGKGLIYGSIPALIYSFIDLFLIKQFIIPVCPNQCGLENYFAIFFSLVYLTIGIILTRKYKSIED